MDSSSHAIGHGNDWKSSARESLERALLEPKSKSALTQIMKTGNYTVDDAYQRLRINDFINQLDRRMRVSAEQTRDKAKVHSESGLYEKIVDVIQPKSSDLVVDLGCGSCYFIRDLGITDGIGADINGYVLQLGKSLLEQSGKKVSIYPASHLDFNHEKGFVLTHDPLTKRLSSDRINLICDNITELNNTEQALVYLGSKANVVTLIFGPGLYPHRNFQFLDDFKKEAKGIPRKDEDPYFVIDNVVDNLPKIMDANGSLYIVLRVPKALSVRGPVLDQGNYLQRKYNGKVQISQKNVFDIPYEEGEVGQIVHGRGRYSLQDTVRNPTQTQAVVLEARLV